MGQLERILQKYPILLQLMRFVAIGLINTALDFAVLNIVSKTLGISSGLKLGGVNTIGFILAVIQSYYWNKYWTFSVQDTVSVLKNAVRLILVGLLGVGVLGAVIVGSKYGVNTSFYLAVLAALIIGEIAIWFSQGIGSNVQAANAPVQFASFIFVSVIGLVINGVLVGYLSVPLSGIAFFAANPDLTKNAAKVLATVVSLVWNFIGYKLLVFKK